MSFRTEQVIVKNRTCTGTNAIGEAVWETIEQLVDGVLIAPGAGQDMTGTIRPDGTRVTYTLYFPKTFTGDLRGATIRVRGMDLAVIGEPDRYLGAPGRWNMVVQVGVVHG